MIDFDLLNEIKTGMEAGRNMGQLTMNEETYNAIPALRRSDIAKVFHNREVVPANYRYLMDNQEEKTGALVMGSAYHKYVLEPNDFYNEYAVWDNDRFNKTTKAGKEAWAAFVEMAGTKTIIDRKGQKSTIGFAEIQDMQKALYQNEHLMWIIENGEKEKVFIWLDEITGLWLKCKTDILGEIDGTPALTDCKTTSDASPIGFYYEAKKFLYDMQVAFYLDGYETVTGIKADFYFMPQEKKPPYLSALYAAPVEMYESGVQKYRTALGVIKECMESGQWYGYEGKFGGVIDIPWFDGNGGNEDAES